MKVSVIVPVYNEEKHIEACLRSLVNQKVEPYEIIVIDNNCTDNTINIVKKYPVKIIKENKQGITHARNRGFDSARGDILARCDADSILPPSWTKKIIDNFKKYNIDALTGPASYHDLRAVDGMQVVRRYLDFMKLVQNNKETLFGPNMAITKSVWEKVKSDTCIDDTKVHEDVDLAIHILKRGGIIRRDNKLLVSISTRRARSKPLSQFVEYPLRLVKTLRSHLED